MSSTQDDREALLLECAREGGEGALEAYEELVSMHHAWLVRLLAYATGSLADADDLAQEVLLAAWRELPRYRGERLRPWLRVAALRKAWNLARDRRTREGYHQEAAGMSSVFVDGPDEEVTARDTLVRVLADLPYPYREVLLLRYVEEMSHRDIARFLGISEGAARMRLKRAREAFWQRHREVAGGA